jgi:hypothetical protein
MEYAMGNGYLTALVRSSINDILHPGFQNLEGHEESVILSCKFHLTVMQIVFEVNVVTETFPLDDISDASGKVPYRNVRLRTVITA